MWNTARTSKLNQVEFLIDCPHCQRTIDIEDAVYNLIINSDIELEVVSRLERHYNDLCRYARPGNSKELQQLWGAANTIKEFMLRNKNSNKERPC